MNEAIKMQISAFVDGELPQNEAELLLRRLCQDAELRQQAAEYLAVGRVMRGERVVAGMGQLRERVAAAIDDKNLQEEFEATQADAPKFVRPAVGVAIAATVALVALLGLQQMAGEPEGAALDNETVAEAPVETYTVPEREDDLLRDYYLSHGESAQQFGADPINPRLVYMQILEETEIDTEEAEASDEDVESEESVEATTP